MHLLILSNIKKQKMLFNEFTADIKKSLKQYASAGLIDDLSVYGWLIEALNELSILPTIKAEEMLTVKNNSAKLPEGFKSMYSAVKCEPYVATIDEPQDDILQESYFYKVRELKNEDWNFCNPCDIVETDTCVVEKTYFHNGTKANFYYNNLQPLKLKMTPYVKRTKCDKNSPNLSINNAPYEISINNKTLYTNFKEGTIFLIYNGYEHDEDGFIIIPETEENNILKYVRAYVQASIVRETFGNSDNTTNEQFLYTLYSQERDKYLTRSTGELKLKRVLDGMGSYRSKINKEYSVYDFGSYSKNNNRNRTDFIVL